MPPISIFIKYVTKINVRQTTSFAESSTIYVMNDGTQYISAKILHHHSLSELLLALCCNILLNIQTSLCMNKYISTSLTYTYILDYQLHRVQSIRVILHLYLQPSRHKRLQNSHYNATEIPRFSAFYSKIPREYPIKMSSRCCWSLEGISHVGVDRLRQKHICQQAQPFFLGSF